MLSFVQLDKPHIDIELYGTDTNIAPIDKVHIMDEDSFEQFTLEWLFGCKNVQHARHAPPNECNGEIRASNKPGIRVEDA